MGGGRRCAASAVALFSGCAPDVGDECAENCRRHREAERMAVVFTVDRGVVGTSIGRLRCR